MKFTSFDMLREIAENPDCQIEEGEVMTLPKEPEPIQPVFQAPPPHILRVHVQHEPVPQPGIGAGIVVFIACAVLAFGFVSALIGSY